MTERAVYAKTKADAQKQCEQIAKKENIEGQLTITERPDVVSGNGTYFVCRWQ